MTLCRSIGPIKIIYRAHNFDPEMEVKLNGVVGKRINSLVRSRKIAEYMRTEVWDWEGVIFVAPSFLHYRWMLRLLVMGLWEIDEDAFA